MKIQSFDPIATTDSKVIILGTMPSNTSLKFNEYYSHPDNLFWDIIFRTCIPGWKIDELVKVEYKEKVKLLESNHIALWDVLKYCDRKGSLDIAIRNQAHNDFKAFFVDFPKIKTVFFNGKKASTFFDDLKSAPEIFVGKTFITLPSTSPSNTQNTFFILKEWFQIRKYIIN